MVWYPPIITKEQLDDQEEYLNDQTRWAYQIAQAKPSCKHEWKSVPGIYREYVNCKHCDLKFEDFEEEQRLERLKGVAY